MIFITIASLAIWLKTDLFGDSLMVFLWIYISYSVHIQPILNSFYCFRNGCEELDSCSLKSGSLQNSFVLKSLWNLFCKMVFNAYSIVLPWIPFLIPKCIIPNETKNYKWSISAVPLNWRMSFFWLCLPPS